MKNITTALIFSLILGVDSYAEPLKTPNEIFLQYIRELNIGIGSTYDDVASAISNNRRGEDIFETNGRCRSVLMGSGIGPNDNCRSLGSYLSNYKLVARHIYARDGYVYFHFDDRDRLSYVELIFQYDLEM